VSERSDILDYLFLPSFGASLTILKVEIGGEVESTNGAEASHRRSATDLGVARGYEWELMVQARARNPSIQLYALAWGWPGYLRNGTNATNPFTSGALVADYLISWLDVAKETYGLYIDFLGIWNEMYFGPYSFMQTLRAAMNAAGYNETKLVVADDYVNRWDIVDVLISNSTLKSAVWGVGVHYPGATSPLEAQALGLPLWASEDDSDGGLNGGACLARAINENYVNGLMTATITWHLASAFYATVPWFGASLLSAGWPTSGAYTVNYALWACAHTAQFVRPGWRYLSHGSGVGYLEGGGTYVSATDGAGGLTIVIEKLSRSTSQCSYAASPPNVTTPEVAILLGLHSFPLFHVWTSNFSSPKSPDMLFQYAGTVSPFPNGSLALPIEVGTVVTLTTIATGSHGNHSAPPPPAPFPLPYRYVGVVWAVAASSSLSPSMRP
jgi:galactosylceramidase